MLASETICAQRTDQGEFLVEICARLKPQFIGRYILCHHIHGRRRFAVVMAFLLFNPVAESKLDDGEVL
jgi:hypothetical protein